MARIELASLVKSGILTYANSHIVYTFRTRQSQSVASSSLIIADLACSEKLRKSVYLGEQLLETVEKTSSLVYFSKCINYLLEGNRVLISRSEDKIVDLLYEALGGNCMTCYVVSISLAEEDKDLTFNTLAFAQKVSTIENGRPAKARQSIISCQIDSSKVPGESTIKQMPSRSEITCSRPSWIEKCTNILNVNGSEMKKLHNRNLELESQVITLEKMLHISQIEQSIMSRESPRKDTSFFSVENDFCFNSSTQGDQDQHRVAGVSFTKARECQMLPGLIDNDCHANCVPVDDWNNEKMVLDSRILNEKAKYDELIKSFNELKKREIQRNAEVERIRDKESAELKILGDKCRGYEESMEQMMLEFHEKIRSLSIENTGLQSLCSKYKDNESHLKDQIIKLQNSRFQLQSEIQQLNTQSKISAQNGKITETISKDLQIENKKLAQKVMSLSAELQVVNDQAIVHQIENMKLISEQEQTLEYIRKLEHQNNVYSTKLAEKSTKQPLRSFIPNSTSKSIAQLRAELRSERQSCSNISDSESKENYQSQYLDHTSKSITLAIDEDDIKYVIMPIGFQISTDSKTDTMKSIRGQHGQLRHGNDSSNKMLYQLNQISAFTPQKTKPNRNGENGLLEEGLSPTCQKNYISVSMAKATEKKRKLSGLLDVLSACQNAFESKIIANEFSEAEFNSEHLRADIAKLWSEMEECLKVDDVHRESVDQISFIHDLLIKLYTLFDKSVASRNNIATKYSTSCAEKVHLSRALTCFAKFIESLHLDDDLILQKKLKFIRERYAVSLISRYYKSYKRKFAIRKLKRVHKTNHQIFQAGSGKFLLQSLMNSTENYFLKLFDKIRPEMKVQADNKTKQLAALAELDSICAQ